MTDKFGLVFSVDPPAADVVKKNDLEAGQLVINSEVRFSFERVGGKNPVRESSRGKVLMTGKSYTYSFNRTIK